MGKEKDNSESIVFREEIPRPYSSFINELEEENRKLKSERDKWRGKYNRLKSEFNLLKNKIWTTQK